MSENEAVDIANKIRHVLTHFPKLSHTMLQIGLGTNLLAKDWRPILEEMIVEGEIRQDVVLAVTTTGRQHSYTIISLTE